MKFTSFVAWLQSEAVEWLSGQAAAGKLPTGAGSADVLRALALAAQVGTTALAVLRCGDTHHVHTIGIHCCKPTV